MNQALLGVLPDPSLLVTTEGRVVAVNSALCELLGSTREALEGACVFAAVTDPESAARHFLEVAACTRTPVPGALTWKLAAGGTIETRCDGAVVERATQGRPAVVYIRCRPREAALSRFIALNDQIQALSKEIRERQNAEAALRRSEERYRTLVAATSNVVYTTDRTGEFVTLQPSWEAFTGQRWEDYRNLGGMSVVHADDRDAMQEAWLRSIKSGEAFDYRMRLWHAPSESYHSCTSRAVPVRGADGQVMEWIGTITDVEDRTRLEEQLRQTQKLESLGVLAGGVAHDFNNLLVGILGNASLAMETLSPNNPARPMLNDVVSASETAAHLTKQLLAYAGKGRFVVDMVDLSDLVRQISSLIQVSIPKNVQLRLELQNRLPCVEADLTQLQQLVMNLVINGAEAIQEGRTGTVIVVTGTQDVDEHYVEAVLAPAQIAPGKYVTLEVHDSGAGMSEDVISRIFDPFFTTKFMGRGLGLAAALGIVRGHKGAIKVYSTPGQGTTMKVLFPAAVEGVPTISAQQPEPERTGSETVLVVDDETVVRRTAKSMLERYGYSVIVAENGQEGLDLFRVLAEKVSVVLLDMTMPVMSGEEAFRQMKSIKPEVRVILSSGYNEVEAVRRFTGKGLAGFLQKPYSAATLAQKVRAVIEQGRMHAKQGE
jgi:two-component system cell cycle sensor histidine kinase/response regulator CckA